MRKLRRSRHFRTQSARVSKRSCSCNFASADSRRTGLIANPGTTFGAEPDFVPASSSVLISGVVFCGTASGFGLHHRRHRWLLGSIQLFFRPPRGFGMFHRGLDHFRQALQCHEVAFLKGARPVRRATRIRRTLLRRGSEASPPPTRCRTRGNSRGLPEDRSPRRHSARIWRVRTLSPERPESICKMRPQLRRRRAGAGAADHGLALAQRDGCSRRSCNVLGALGQ